MSIHSYNFRGIPFPRGVNFQTNAGTYTTSRELMARRSLHEYEKKQKSGNIEPPKIEIKGKREVEVTIL